MHAAAVRDFPSWRREARALLAEQVPPEEVAWQQPRDTASLPFAPPERSPDLRPTHIPRELARLLEACACHRDRQRWAVMYRVLWRVVRGGERRLLDDPADGDMVWLRLMAKAVEREVHKMHAFVRFRETRAGDGTPLYVAWFEPEHDILRRAAPFFRDRFAAMRWIIATPHGAVRWDGHELAYCDSPLQRPEGHEDAAETLWRTYYASIFNPARLNERMLQKEMPRRYWKNLPEAQDIAQLARAASPRVAAMKTAQSVAPRWAAKVDVYVAVPRDVQACRRCALWERATQAVQGAGPEGAAIMLVGEQPGDEEDLKGRPFVGPAGKVLDRALAAAGVERNGVYVTNAVKHFKWEPRGKRRLHKTPAQREVEACGHWLEEELRRVKPKVLVAMGGTAVYALLRQKGSIRALRGAALRHAGGAQVVVTYHPSAVLRAQEEAGVLFEALCEDLKRAASVAEAASTGWHASRSLAGDEAKTHADLGARQP